jgi:hypothetical protein
MSEYILRPNQKGLPPPQDLLDDLARRGWNVDLNLKGHADSWEAIRFFRPGPPEEVECFLLHDPETHVFTLSLPALPAHGARELQYRVLESLLKRLGGIVEEVSNRKRRTLTQHELTVWGSKYRPFPLNLLQGDPGEVFWRLFPWAVAVAATLYSLFGPPEKRLPALVLAALALLSSVGLLYHSLRD